MENAYLDIINELAYHGLLFLIFCGFFELEQITFDNLAQAAERAVGSLGVVRDNGMDQIPLIGWCIAKVVNSHLGRLSEK